MNEQRDSAGVWFPPPLIYVIGLLAAFTLSRIFPPVNVPDVIGAPMVVYAYFVLFLALGVLMLLWAFGTFKRAGTAILPISPTSQVVESGPYQLTRNPMYVAMSFIYLGLGALVSWGYSILLLPVVLIVIYLYVIRREERYLTAKFGQEYLEYKERVRRWI
ncbi:MAG: isoprenylcysteine carboxylmethyltransferase family protein [Gemmatimonadaceae bacterium]|nr:isoprenylcysteine carboxylmethyltransferase family protein [Gemmatimonadaceae bacterium]